MMTLPSELTIQYSHSMILIEQSNPETLAKRSRSSHSCHVARASNWIAAPSRRSDDKEIFIFLIKKCVY